MVFDSYGTISDIEILWVVGNLAGVVFSSVNARQAALDLRATNTLTTANGRRREAVRSLRVEIARIAIQAIFLAIGIGAMTFPDPQNVDMPLHIVVYGALFRWGLIICSWLVTYQSVENWLTRRYLDTHATYGGGIP